MPTPDQPDPLDKIGLYSEAQVDAAKIRAQAQKAREDADKQFSKLKEFNSPIQPAQGEPAGSG